MAKRQKRKRTSAKEIAKTRKSSGESNYIKLPEGMEFFRVDKSGPKKLDFLPYVTKSNPYVDDGYEHYERTYWAHRGVGADQRTYLCPSKTAGKKCPICEHVRELNKEKADEDTIRALLPKQRQLWLVVDLDEKEKGVQLWDFSYHLFGKLLDEQLKYDEDGEHEFFYGIEDGQSARVIFDEETMGGFSFFKAVSIQFKKRPPYSEDIADSLPCLDDLLVIEDYESLYAIFFQEEGPPEKTSGKDEVEVPWDGDDDDDEEVTASVGDDDEEFQDDDWD